MKFLFAMLYVAAIPIFFPMGLVFQLNNSSSTTTTSQSPSSGLPSSYFTCLKISDLQKDPTKIVCFVKNSWLNYVASFATDIDEFLETQWQGGKPRQYHFPVCF